MTENTPSDNQDYQIQNRRSFAIISHPDAGKTTITERFLHIGGAINMIGTVKAKKSKAYARSDWLEIEKKRGISVTSSVLKFNYEDYEVNLIDTPGHQDFSEDTYRTLTAVDSTLMIIDGAQGVESQTKKLFEVCKIHNTPSVGFINKMDRPSKDPFELMEQIEKLLQVDVCFYYFPILTQDARFIGLYNFIHQNLILFNDKNHNNYHPDNQPPTKKQTNQNQPKLNALKNYSIYHVSYKDPNFDEFFKNDPEILQKLKEDLSLIEEVQKPFDQEKFLKAEIVPLFFGSAMKNVAIEILLKNFLTICPPPKPRLTSTNEIIDPYKKEFSAFIFKIQANMDPSHRDRIAFMRICSGMFQKDMKVFHVRNKRQIRLSRPTKFLAKDRSIIDQAYPGDIVGVHDPGIFIIGDTLTSGRSFFYTNIPVFSPEHFALVQLSDPLKSKTLIKGLTQLSQEGAVQVFKSLLGNRLELGVVGKLQFDVVQFRLKSEYNLDINLKKLPYSTAAWISSSQKKVIDKFIDDNKDQIYYDSKNHPVIFADDDWRIDLMKQRNPDVNFAKTKEFSYNSD